MQRCALQEGATDDQRVGLVQEMHRPVLRLDTLNNLIADPTIGMLFLVPGFSEMLRVNGAAEIRDDAEHLEQFAIDGMHPATVLVITVKEVFLHCAKAVKRSRLWDDAARTDRSRLPTMGQTMLK
jgi:hypothetical protein